MRSSRFTKSQILSTLNEAEAGRQVIEVAYKLNKRYIARNPELLSILFSSRLFSSFRNFTKFCYPQRNESLR